MRPITDNDRIWYRALNSISLDDLGVGLFCIAIGIQLGTFSFISDSEFWSVSVASVFGQLNTAEYAIYYKPLFHGVLHIPYLLDLSNGQHLYFVKGLFGCIGGLIVFSYYFLAKNIWGRRAGLLLILFLLSSNLFYTQFYRLRSDILACLFAGLQLLILVRPSGRKLLVSALVSLLMIWTTPKAAYFLMVNFIFYFFALKDHPPIIRLTKAISATVLAPSLFIIIAAFIPIGDLDFRTVYVHALDYFLANYYLDPLRDPDINHWRFIRDYGQIDIVHWIAILLIVGYLMLKVKWRLLNGIERGFLAVLPITSLVILGHNQKYPFFLASWLPYFAIVLAMGQSKLAASVGRRALLSFLMLWTLNFFAQFQNTWWWKNSHGQMEKIAELELFVKLLSEETRRPVRVFDGQGILPKENQILAFFSPADFTANSSAVTKIKSLRPEVILRLMRASLGDPMFTEALISDYKPVGGGVFVRKDIPTSLTFRNSPHLAHVFDFN